MLLIASSGALDAGKKVIMWPAAKHCLKACNYQPLVRLMGAGVGVVAAVGVYF